MNLELNLAIGGLGLFLFGMSAMTGGLKSLADDRLRELLARSTKSPLSGVLTGMTATAIVQSSSATTVAAVGFVDAGLLTFPAALGIVLGANIGTTITGWFVALLGFKLKLGQLMLPVILFGALLGLSERRRMSAVGSALAGFGLIFIGIDFLQQGVGGMGALLAPDRYSDETFGGRLALVGIGAAITVLTQSSSAGVAMALASLHAGAIGLGQAAALVIGMSLGTTSTAALATIGGNVQAKRTGFAYVFYNTLVALAALGLLTPYLSFLERLFPGEAAAEPELLLVGFHTLFHTLGVLVALPLTGGLARLITWMIPETGDPLVRRLDKTLQATPEMALAAVSSTLHELIQRVYAELAFLINTNDTGRLHLQKKQLLAALEQTQEYLREIPIASDSTAQSEHFLTAMHLLDHLRRTFRRLDQEQQISQLLADSELTELSATLKQVISEFPRVEPPLDPEIVDRIRGLNQQVKTREKKYREQIVARVAAGGINSREAIARMDSARWIRRMTYHAWRIVYHLRKKTPPETDEHRFDDDDET
jgi:phosphate:Na+ symporter